MVQKGLIHIYTGTGKGKTTAALGLCFRAAGWGIRSAFIQFMKGQDTGEIHASEKFSDLIIFEQYGSSGFIKDRSSDSYREHLVATAKGLARAAELLKEKRYSIIVLDEILTLPQFGLLPEQKIIEIIEMKPPAVELILTGRGATPGLIQRADLVTEMMEIKHYYNSGVIARKGIEY
jgi:cob(I)alamin adenosyltransferase